MKRILCSLLALVMCISMAATVFAAEMKFTDVKTSDWFYDDVKTAVESGLVNGKSATTYAPNDNLTYAEAIKLAACMNQLYVDGEITLEGGNPWYKPYVDYCIDEEIIDKEYNYEDFATRAGYMGIFAKALPEEGLKEINIVPDDSIPDVPSSRSYAKGVYKLYRAGILQGVDEAHNCNPLANITRAEVAAILTRMMNEEKRVSITDMGKEEEKKEETKPEEKEENKEETKALAIKTQPEDVTIKAGERPVFEVEAEGGKTPYTYQWQSRENNLEWENCDSEDFGEGSKTEKYTVYTGSMSFTAEYRCIVTDAEGNTVTSEVATLTSVGEEEKKEETTEPENSENNESSGGPKDKFQKTETTEDAEDKGFLMYAEEVFYITGRGVVATGRIIKGELKKGDAIKIISADGSETEATVARIEMFKKNLDEAKKGDNIGLLLNPEIEKGDVARGDSLIGANSPYGVYEKMIGTLTLKSTAEGGRTNVISEGFEASFYRSGHDFVASITGLDDGTMNPGETQDKVTVITKTFRGVFYVGQVLEVREGGRVIGSFTIDSFSSGGREFIPNSKSQYIED